MALARAVYDSFGYEIVERGTEVSQDLLRTLEIHGVAELIIEDWRVYDVPVQPLISPENEGRAVQALRTIMTESQGSLEVEEMLLEAAEDPVLQMTKELFPEVIGEVNASGCSIPAEYYFTQPAKTVGLCLLMGRRIGMGMMDLADLGIAALLKDVGWIALPKGLADKADPTPDQTAEIRKHPLFSAKILSQYERFSPQVVTAVALHHEQWDGTGYPKGLKKDETPLTARILNIADSYYELVSKRPGKDSLMPHEAVEYIMAFGGDLFDPELVGLFIKQMPLYPTGITVKLSNQQVGIVSDSNLGIVGRPVVRICFDERERPVAEPYDVNLAGTENQSLMILQVMDY